MSNKIIGYTGTWEPKTWNGLTRFYGYSLWTDGTDIYYSNDSDQYKLDKATGTWEPVTWNGFTRFYGDYIWTDGTDIYYSDVSDQYKLDKATSTWEPITWNGFTNVYGDYIWTDGTDIYYSDDSDQYKLDKATGTWEPVTWNGFTNVNGVHVWTDGTDTYYSYGSDQYKLDKATGTWEPVTWNGFTNVNSNYIWTDGTDTYYSFGSDQYKLDKATGTWEPKTWNGFTNVDSNYIWTDGTDTYYSDGGDQYILIREPIYAEDTSSTAPLKVKDKNGNWVGITCISIKTHGGSAPVAAAVKLDTKVPCLTANGDVVIMYDADGNVLAHKSDIENAVALTRFAMYEIRNIYIGETCPFDTSDVNAEQVSSIYVDGDGYLAYNDVDDTEGENPRQMLEWDSLNEATIDFASIAGYPRYS